MSKPGQGLAGLKGSSVEAETLGAISVPQGTSVRQMIPDLEKLKWELMNK